MKTGWVSINGKEYYLEESGNSSIPEGSMITGWRNFPIIIAGNSKNQWAFFNLSTGECEVKEQVTIGCVHGKTTYDDNILLTLKTNITYTYIGEKFIGNVIDGANNWTNSNAGVTLNFVDPTSAPSKIKIYDSVTNDDLLAFTKFISGSSDIDPRSGDWTLGEIYLNIQKTTANIRSGIIAHEIGHALGLDHRDADKVSLMRPDIAGGSRNVPAAIDISNIQHIY